MPDALPSLSPAELSRYRRQVQLDEVGVEGQHKLAAARVLVVGAGGLGSPAALYLAAAGVGTLGLADRDRVEEHNLQRQIIHGTPAVGQPKVESAARQLANLNPHVRLRLHGGDVAGQVLGGRVLIVAIHDYRPALPWPLYNLSQALIHLGAMRGFARYLAGLAPPGE